MVPFKPDDPKKIAQWAMNAFPAAHDSQVVGGNTAVEGCGQGVDQD